MNMHTTLRIIDLDSGCAQLVTWDPSVPDDVFESVFEGLLRETFGITEDAWVDLIDLNNSSLVPMHKDALLASQAKSGTPLVLTLSSKTEALSPLKKDDIIEVVFTERSLGITIRDYHRDNVVVNAFRSNADGTMGYAESTRLVALGDVVYKVGGVRAIGRPYDSVIQMLQSPIRPLSVHFFRPRMREGLYAVEFTGASLNMTITTDDTRVLVSRLPQPHANVMGYAEAHGVRLGDSIHAIDGHILDGPEYGRAVSLLKRPQRPMIVVFWRASVTPQYLPQVDTPKSVSGRSTSGSISSPSPRMSSKMNVITPNRAKAMTFSGNGVSQSPRPSPRPSPRMSTKHSSYDVYNNTNTIQGGSLFGDNMSVDDMIDYCETIASIGVVSAHETEILKDMLNCGRGDLASAIRHRNKNAIVALVRSPTMRLWDHLLKTRESIILAGPVTFKKTKRYHLLLTDHERVLFVNKATNALEDEILCSHIVTVSSRSKVHELVITTTKAEYILNDSFIGPSVWVRAILPFTNTQGYLKVDSNSLLGSKKRYFVLKGEKLSGYKKDSVVNAQEAKPSTVLLRDAVVRVIDAKAFKFEISTPELAKGGKKLTLIAANAREYNKWISSLQAFQLQRNTTVGGLPVSPSAA
ncbi:hypothetical protein ACHHYP_08926 [Achlya hypogyna]|uniref:PH domain-containing protein n=1 Tax=Achlya hypogyna TaxID=1202772 RepID=A0A1V9ZJT5_ACHHY|nr:hypothetical protein ACHHYP_08926 [Achlya hypogyna]